jgi:hypothetical protein
MSQDVELRRRYCSSSSPILLRRTSAGFSRRLRPAGTKDEPQARYEGEWAHLGSNQLGRCDLVGPYRT